MHLLIGTYTESLGHVDGSGPGILPCRFCPDTGALEPFGEPATVRNPSYLCRVGRPGLVVASSEICDFDGRRDGCLTALAFAPATGSLSPLSVASAAGAGPAWVHPDRTGRFLLVANYVEGNVAAIPIATDGQLGRPACIVPHAGCGPDPARQEAPHPHAFLAAPDNAFAYAADLGTDTVHGYTFAADSGALSPTPAATCALPAGSGPRHIAFHPHAPLALVDLELSSEVALLEHEPATGALRCRQIISTRPAGARGVNHPSEILISADGRHACVANRGDDTISVFAIETAPTPRLIRIGCFPCGGRTPRHIALSPDGRFLLVANQDSDTVTVLARDPTTGTLTQTGQSLHIGTPCFVLFG